MSYSQSLSFQEDDDFIISQSFSQFNFQDFTLPSQSQASQLDHHIGSQVKLELFDENQEKIMMTHNCDKKREKKAQNLNIIKIRR